MKGNSMRLRSTLVALFTLGMALVHALPSSAQQSSNPAAQLTAQQCDAGYLAALAEMRICMRMVPRPESNPAWTTLEEINAKMKENGIDFQFDNTQPNDIYDWQTPHAGVANAWWYEIQKYVDQAFIVNNKLIYDYFDAFWGCIDKASSTLKTLALSCPGKFDADVLTAGASPQKLNRTLYCGGMRTAIASCRQFCSKTFGGPVGIIIRLAYSSSSCGKCDSLENSIWYTCAPPTAKLPMLGGPCKAELDKVQACVNFCIRSGQGEKSGGCRQDCDALSAALVDTCFAGISTNPPPQVSKSDSPSGRKQNPSGAQGAKLPGESKNSGLNINNKKALAAKRKKPLPPSPCRKGQDSCVVARGSTGSPGITNNKPKNNLDQHELGPNFVNTNPNAGRIGTRPGGGGGAGGGGSSSARPAAPAQPAVSGGAGASAPVFIPR
jgi:hypothetical protein